MESKRNMDRLVEETLNSVSGIKPVKTPPFFKDKVLNSMAQSAIKKEELLPIFNWFTPKFQAAVLVCFVVINTAAVLSYTTDTYGENVKDFAEVYGLTETETGSYLYQN